nr:hypothetical protein [Tanacetum cinerariifolium]
MSWYNHPGCSCCGGPFNGGNCPSCSSELAEYINTRSWNRLAFYNYDDDDDEDYTIAITITPILPTEEPVDSLIIEDEHLDTISITESDEPLDSEPVSLKEVKDEILCVKLFNVNLLIAKIESLNDNPILDRVLKSPSPFPIPVEDSHSFIKKFDTYLSYSDNSLPEFETFSDQTEETSSGSTITYADNSLPEYDSFLF